MPVACERRELSLTTKIPSGVENRSAFRQFGSADCTRFPFGAMDEVRSSIIGETIRHLDELIAEARRLRERITAALRREEEPFFPERRYRYEQHEPERRAVSGTGSR